MIKSIKTNRIFEDHPSWNIVHEWEDILVNHLNIPLVSKDAFVILLMLIPFDRIRKKLCYFYFYFKRTIGGTLVFHVKPLKYSWQVNLNDLPIVIDIFGDTNLEQLEKVYSKCKIVFVTSLEVLHYLESNNVNINLEYLPISLPDSQYLGRFDKIDNFKLLKNKDIDIIEIGRSNTVLTGWLEMYLLEYPRYRFVYQKRIGEKIIFLSNDGMINEIRKERSDYFRLLARSKVVLYSSAGIDNGVNRAGNFNALTPRLLECLSRFTYIISRHADNEDFKEVNSFIDNVNSYEQFKVKMNLYLVDSDYNFLAWSDTFLKGRLTSQWVAQLSNLRT
jgi:hypothetical protein